MGERGWPKIELIFDYHSPQLSLLCSVSRVLVSSPAIKQCAVSMKRGDSFKVPFNCSLLCTWLRNYFEFINICVMEAVVKYKALISDQLDGERLYMHNFQHILNRLSLCFVCDSWTLKNMKRKSLRHKKSIKELGKLWTWNFLEIFFMLHETLMKPANFALTISRCYQ